MATEFDDEELIGVGEDGEDEPEVTDEDEIRFNNVINRQGSEKISAIKLYLKEIRQYAVLTKEEEFALACRVSEGDQVAREKLVHHNLRLVVSLAKKYVDKLDFEELIAQGNMGLITAVDRFDWKVGTKFSTYAVPWIKLEMEKAIQSKMNLVSKPAHVVAAMKAISNASRCAEMVLGRQATSDEISRILDGKFTPEQVDEYIVMMVKNTPVSLDKNLGDSDDDATVGDLVGDTAETPDERMMREEQTRTLNQEILNLPPVQVRVLCLRYGWNESREHTLDEIAAILQSEGFANKKGKPFSKEYIRQLEEKALKTLRNNPAILALMQ